MDRILFRDVRCFRGEHDIPFAPLTFLVGENSTGKSTILAMTRVAWDVGHAWEEPDFNEEPFQLGSFAEIASATETQTAKPAPFSVGFSRPYDFYPARTSPYENSEVRFVGAFTPVSGQPSLTSFTATNSELGAWLLAHQGQMLWQLGAQSGTISFPLETPVGRREVQNLLTTLPHIPTALENFPDRGEYETLLSALELDTAHQLIFGDGKHISYPRRRPLALAPVRTRPRRTYDPLRETRSPEGDHVPMLLARLRATDPAAWEALAADLAEYGRGAGLFSDLLVRRFDGNEASPFQLQVRLAGQNREVNLIDVGYGVSQVLPILVDAFTQPEESSFLLQQPEVHLHPKAQAELGSMLVSLVKRRRHKFMIETHSDHLVDRVRLEVKRGKIPAEDVRIVYCERADSHVLTHEIKVDANGNLIGAPEGYRQFFLDEELALLGG